MLRQAFRAAIVDLDGTLADTLGDFEVALNRMLVDLDLPPANRELVGRTVGKGSGHLIRSILAHHLSQPEVEVAGCQQTRLASEVDKLFVRALPAYQRHYRVINGEFSVVYPGVVEGLQALREAGLLLACLTNKPQASAQDLLASKSLAGYFELADGGDSFERKKPDLYLFSRLAKRCAPQLTRH